MKGTTDKTRLSLNGREKTVERIPVLESEHDIGGVENSVWVSHPLPRLVAVECGQLSLVSLALSRVARPLAQFRVPHSLILMEGSLSKFSIFRIRARRFSKNLCFSCVTPCRTLRGIFGVVGFNRRFHDDNTDRTGFTRYFSLSTLIATNHPSLGFQALNE